MTLDLEEIGMHHDDSLAKLQSPKQVARLLGPFKHLLNITSCQPIMSCIRYKEYTVAMTNYDNHASGKAKDNVVVFT